MKSNTPIDPRIRLAISQWPDDAPRGSVASFCAEHDISRNTFYRILKRAREAGPAAALEPQSRRPHTSPTRIGDEVKRQALEVRAALADSGLDHGPISVHDKMRSLGFTTPSVASLARIFRAHGVAKHEPRKRPRSSFRRFVYPAPNACWQLDATEYPLAAGGKAVIFQLIDDHSRFALASHVASGETTDGALAVVREGINRHGRPQRLLTDNGVALNPSRRGYLGRLVAYASTMGIETITGKPGKPTTQGKNERFHQTLFRWLNRQPLARSLSELQALVDQFDHIYNTERPHQGLPDRITPIEAWKQAPKAPPRPLGEPLEITLPKQQPRRPPAEQTGGETGETDRIVGATGIVVVLGTMFPIHQRLAGLPLRVLWDKTHVRFFTDEGLHLMTYPRPRTPTRYMLRRRAKHLNPELKTL